MPKFAVITGFLGQTKDRFHTYHQQRNLEEKLSLLSSIPGYTGAEVVYPYEAKDAELLSDLLKKYNLEISAINVNIKGEPEFVSGSITSPDKAVRGKAVSFIKDAKDFAIAIGAPRVTCCPLGDGFEFVFQEDYRKAWKRLCDGFGEAGSYKTEMPLFIEYKPKETRGRCFLNRAAETLCLLSDIGEPSMGVTMDYGHSIYADEHPAQTLALLAESGRAYYIHINDNDKTWDWDYFCGSHTLLEYIEFIYYLKTFGYEDFLTSDTHPTRYDPVQMYAINSRITEKIWKLLDTIGMAKIQKKIDSTDYLATWKFIEEEFFNLR